MADQNHIHIEVNMDKKALVGMTLLFSRTNKLETTPLKVDVVPELEADYQKRVRPSGKLFINTNAPHRFPGKPLDTD